MKLAQLISAYHEAFSVRNLPSLSHLADQIVIAARAEQTKLADLRICRLLFSTLGLGFILGLVGPVTKSNPELHVMDLDLVLNAHPKAKLEDLPRIRPIEASEVSELVNAEIFSS